jgi:potassium-transporting ATPase potassium-binding subunit
MTANGWLQLALILGAMAAITKPLGIYLVRVLDPEHEGPTFLDRFLGPIERFIYRLIGVDPKREQDWKRYTFSMVLFTAVPCLATYVLLRLQAVLPLNPQGMAAVRPDLAFNTAASFSTNTNWQSYGGESTMSYFSQMVALVSHNFISAAVGIATAAALVRGIARSSGSTLGNFWRDIVRQTLYLYLPASLVYAVFLMSQGIPMNFLPYTAAKVVDQAGATTPVVQNIVQGPIASQIAIKMLGTNGGGYLNANAAHPFENPTTLSNFVQIVLFIAICSALTYYLGRMVKNQKHGWAVWASMFGMLVAGILVCWWAEAHGNPRMEALGVDPSMGNMEGKEVRFGIANSSIFASMTTATGCGAVNAMHDSFTPIGGLVTLGNILMGEVIFGGVGSGLYGMLVFVFVAIFIAGLMVGRTPEYLGKKIEARDVKLAALSMLVTGVFVIGLTAWASVSDWAAAGLNNSGPHGFSEMLYAFASGTGNNGSAFAGLTMTPTNGNIMWNLTQGLSMLLGRLLPAIPVMALAGALVAKKATPPDAGSFPVTGGTFVILLTSTVLIVGALTFLPALAVGPIVEHFLMVGSTTTY